MYSLMFYLTIINRIFRHCHFWLARQYILLIYYAFACQGVKLLDRLPYMPVWRCSCLNNFQYLEMLLIGIQKYVINGLNDLNK